MTEDQYEVIAFLSDPANYGPGLDKVDTITTYISIVFLAGDRAYKLKRAVRYPFIDFSTAARRAKACAAELQLNRRTAPELYLETKSICRGADGRIGWGGGVSSSDNLVDTVVVMRRFDQDRLLDAVAGAGALNPALLYALAAHIADFHAAAEQRRDFGGAGKMNEVAATTMRNLHGSHRLQFDAGRLDRLNQLWLDELPNIALLLDRRRAEGKVRRCHGDLHLRNICLVDDRPLLFDCIEFSDDIATIDILYDVAFLVMDLAHRDRRADANRLLNRYLDLTEEDDGLAAIPFFISLRAAIRAQVLALAHDRGDTGRADDAYRYLDEAIGALRRSPPRLIAIGGLSGSGKSSVAARLAPDLGPVPGARILRSDVLRKRQFGVPPESPLPASAYSETATQAVYRELCSKASTALRAGYCAIIDAVALRPEERKSFAAVAERAGVAFTGIWLDAPSQAMATRIGERRGDASDASTSVLDRQLQVDIGPLDWIRIEAGGGAEDTLRLAKRALDAQ
jgi:aminoglycoside phosphotransferase family enzyme/predicted kinase